MEAVLLDVPRDEGNDQGVLQTGDAGLLLQLLRVDGLVDVEPRVVRDADQDGVRIEHQDLPVLLGGLTVVKPVDEDDGVLDDALVTPVTEVVHGGPHTFELVVLVQGGHDQHVALLERRLDSAAADGVGGVVDGVDRVLLRGDDDRLGRVVVVALLLRETIGDHQLDVVGVRTQRCAEVDELPYLALVDAHVHLPDGDRFFTVDVQPLPERALVRVVVDGGGLSAGHPADEDRQDGRAGRLAGASLDVRDGRAPPAGLVGAQDAVDEQLLVLIQVSLNLCGKCIVGTPAELCPLGGVDLRDTVGASEELVDGVAELGPAAVRQDGTFWCEPLGLGRLVLVLVPCGKVRTTLATALVGGGVVGAGPEPACRLAVAAFTHGNHVLSTLVD